MTSSQMLSRNQVCQERQPNKNNRQVCQECNHGRVRVVRFVRNCILWLFDPDKPDSRVGNSDHSPLFYIFLFPAHANQVCQVLPVAAFR